MCCTGKHLEGDVALLPPQTVFPVDWRNARGDTGMPNAKEVDFKICNYHDGAHFNAEKCKRFFPKAYTITWWAHSWGKR